MLTESTEAAPKSLPVWLSIPIILLSLGAGGYIIHWYVMTDPISHESKILGDATAQAGFQGGGGRRFNPGMQGVPGGVQVGPGNQPRIRQAAPQRRFVSLDQGSGDVDIRTEKARASATVTNGKATIHYLFYINTSFLPADAHKTLLAALSLHRNQAAMEAMKLDMHQMNKIGALSNSLPMALTPADKEAFGNAVASYVANAGDRSAAEPKLMQLLDDIADRSMDATKQEATDRAAQINSIITPEMWKLNK
jgi:hypothetical protein